MRGMLRTTGWATTFLTTLCWFSFSQVNATDYFLTLGGGYAPRGNQASLEANVLFFEEVLAFQKVQSGRHIIFFADGNDPEADLQYAVDPSESVTPATDLLRELFSRARRSVRVAYRNHRISNAVDRLEPTSIESVLQEIGQEMQAGDRLVIYVTAHGSRADGDNTFDTSIDCWGGKKITAHQLEKWLGELPSQCAVIMVMAQCYCGGFAHTMFRHLDPSQGLAQPLRAGFFAQRYDRAATGCRPEIDNDEEYSSYFWGALVGHTRNGRELPDGDLNGDGVVSFAEAHAIAVAHSETIDIPLRTSDAYLRRYSRIRDYQLDWAIWPPPRDLEDAIAMMKARLPSSLQNFAPEQPPSPPRSVDDESAVQVDDAEEVEGGATQSHGATFCKEADLAAMEGSMHSILEGADPTLVYAITELCRRLNIVMETPVEEVLEQRQLLQGRLKQQRRMRLSAMGKVAAARRQLAKQILQKWPELKEPRNRYEHPLLAAENQKAMYEQITQLAGWADYQRHKEQVNNLNWQRIERELQLAKLERLQFLLESVVLARNLPKVASADRCLEYQRIVELEHSAIRP